MTRQRSVIILTMMALALAGVALGSPELGAQPGDRLLTAGASEILCFDVTLPLDATNALAGASANLAFVFHAEEARSRLPKLAAEQVIGEPAPRNTAAAVGLATFWALARDPDAIVAILPADHHIGDDAAFRAVLADAERAAAEGHIVTLGMAPTRPETGYGYIHAGEEAMRVEGRPVVGSRKEW